MSHTYTLTTGKQVDKIHTSYVCIQMSWSRAGGGMCPTSTKNDYSNKQTAVLASFSNISKHIV